jgi:1,4-alpha-glucan branching enzyme/maltooligosyltrehalose trehalohydrolase
MRCRHAMPFGASILDGGRGARFRLWAPSAGEVSLLLHPAEGDRGEPRRVVASRGDDGFVEVDVDHVAAGQRYQWQVRPSGGGDALGVPDPASRHNPDGPHGPSVLLDPRAFDWSADAGWRGRPWHEAVFYELHVGSFTPEGTYDAAMRRLPALAELGITALQLMPLADFPGRFGWGYDGVLPYAPFHGYGTPDDLKRLVVEAHRLGLMVFGDVVYNHFGPDGNYLHAYAEAFFSRRHQTAWGAALNYDGEGADPVREFVIHNALYWLTEFRFDGLRLDAVHAMVDDSAEHILTALSRRVREAITDRPVHLVLENDHNDDRRLSAVPGTPGRYDGQWNGDVHHTLHVLMTGERDGYYAEYDAPLHQLAHALVHGYARQGAPHLSEDQPGAEPRRAADRSAPLPAMVNFLHNHDQIGNRAFGERLTTLADPQALRLATAIVLLSPTIPMLFMGEEWGSTKPFLYVADWQGELREAVREGRRREFAHFPRYAQAAEAGTLPDPCSAESLARCTLHDDDGEGAEARAWNGLFRQLLALRREHLVPRLASLAPNDRHAAAITGTVLEVRWRFDDDAASGAGAAGDRTPSSGGILLLQANLGDEAASATPAPTGALPLFATGQTDEGNTLGPWSGRWHWLPTSSGDASAPVTA